MIKSGQRGTGNHRVIWARVFRFQCSGFRIIRMRIADCCPPWRDCFDNILTIQDANKNEEARTEFSNSVWARDFGFMVPLSEA